MLANYPCNLSLPWYVKDPVFSQIVLAEHIIGSMADTQNERKMYTNPRDVMGKGQSSKSKNLRSQKFTQYIGLLNFIIMS